MAKITTGDCKKFLVQFFKDTPDLVAKIYNDDEFDTTGADALKDALIASNWKRESKVKPGSDNSALSGSSYTTMIRFAVCPRGPHYHRGVEIPSNSIVAERRFVLRPDIYDTTIAYLVLEDTLGNLYLGEYVGD